MDYKNYSDESLLSLAEEGNKARVEIERRSKLSWKWSVMGQGIESGHSFIVATSDGSSSRSNAFQEGKAYLRSPSAFSLRTWDKCMYWIKVEKCST